MGSSFESKHIPQTTVIENYPSFLEDTASPHAYPGLKRRYLYYAMAAFGNPTTGPQVTLSGNLAQFVTNENFFYDIAIEKRGMGGTEQNLMYNFAYTPSSSSLDTTISKGMDMWADTVNKVFAVTALPVAKALAATLETSFRTLVSGHGGTYTASLMAGLELRSGALADATYALAYERSKTDHAVEKAPMSFAWDIYRRSELMQAFGAQVQGRVINQDAQNDIIRARKEWITMQLRQYEIYGNALRSIKGAEITQTRPFYSPPKATAILGGILTGAAAGFMSGAGPMGAIVGGVVGGTTAAAGVDAL